MKLNKFSGSSSLLVVLVIPLLFLGCKEDNLAPGIPIEGTWGTEHTILVANAAGATLEYDCAHGTIDEPLIPDGDGHFDVGGTHAWEHGGPIQEGEEEILPARYQGFVFRNSMTLTVTLTDNQEVLGPFVLTQADPGTVYKCL